MAPVPINSIAAAQEHYSLYGQTYGAVVNMNPNPIDNTTGAAFFPYAHDDQQQQQHQNRSRSLTPSSATLARHYLDQQQQQCQFQHQSPQHFTSATLGRLSSSQQRRPVLHHVTAANSSSNLIDGERWVSSARGGGPSTTPPRHFTTSSAIEDEMNEVCVFLDILSDHKDWVNWRGGSLFSGKWICFDSRSIFGKNISTVKTFSRISLLLEPTFLNSTHRLGSQSDQQALVGVAPTTFRFISLTDPPRNSFIKPAPSGFASCLSPWGVIKWPIFHLP